MCDIVNTSKLEGEGMKILKGYVFKMYPNEKQQELINKTIECSGFIYNYFSSEYKTVI